MCDFLSPDAGVHKAFYTVAAIGCVRVSQCLGQVERKKRTRREGR